MISLLLLASTLAIPSSTPSAKPNILLIITDDQGYGDLSYHGNPILKTPNLDRFAAESLRLTQFHVSPTCAPTRAALLTGKHEFRSGVTHTIQERERLARTATTLPQWLQGAGYRTGIFGKWHLGDEDAYLPSQRGFDEVFIHGGGGIGQTYPGSCGDAPKNLYQNPAIWHNNRFVKTQGYCTDVFFDQALSWIESQKGKSPFYCHIATNTPHAPLQCPAEWEAKYAGKVLPDVAKFFGMIENIDANMGKLLGKLRDWGLERDTLVLFMTDNGGTIGCKLFNAGMRGQKGTAYLGGVRVPCFVRWPGGEVQARDFSNVTAHIDWFPTFAQLVGRPLPQEFGAEGISLLPVLQNAKVEWLDRTLVTHLGRWPTGKMSEAKYRVASIRDSQYQLVSPRMDGKKAWELYDLNRDPGQTKNILAEQPEAVRRLEAAYDRWWDSIAPGLVNEAAIGPKVNPFHERYWRQFPDEKPAGK
jgi:arylsulfatase